MGYKNEEVDSSSITNSDDATAEMIHDETDELKRTNAHHETIPGKILIKFPCPFCWLGILDLNVNLNHFPLCVHLLTRFLREVFTICDSKHYKRTTNFWIISDSLIFHYYYFKKNSFGITNRFIVPLGPAYLFNLRYYYVLWIIHPWFGVSHDKLCSKVESSGSFCPLSCGFTGIIIMSEGGASI